jgi:DNA-binding GntR family transcriptional regulator
MLDSRAAKEARVERRLERLILRDQIRERILARILDGTYPPGSRVIESQVAHEFGTSQAPVREALRDLEGMRMIETKPHVGARVREVTTDELAQIYPVRAALEEVAGREAASRISEEDLAKLEAELTAMRQAAEQREVHRQLTHDVRFHELIVESSGNQILLEVWRSLRVEARTLISVIKTDGDLRMIAEMHRPVLAALRSRDPELAGKEMRAHIEFFGSLVKGNVGQGP